MTDIIVCSGLNQRYLKHKAPKPMTKERRADIESMITHPIGNPALLLDGEDAVLLWAELRRVEGLLAAPGCALSRPVCECCGGWGNHGLDGGDGGGKPCIACKATGWKPALAAKEPTP